MPLRSTANSSGLSFLRWPRKIFLSTFFLSLTAPALAAKPTCDSAIFKHGGPAAGTDLTFVSIDRMLHAPRTEPDSLERARTVFQLAKGAKIPVGDPIRTFLLWTKDQNSESVRSHFPADANPLNRWVEKAVLIGYGQVPGVQIFYVVAPLEVSAPKVGGQRTSVIASAIVDLSPGTSREQMEAVFSIVWSHFAHGVDRSESAWLKQQNRELGERVNGVDHDPDLDRFRPLFHADGGHSLVFSIVLDPRRISVREFNRFALGVAAGPRQTIH